LLYRHYNKSFIVYHLEKCGSHCLCLVTDEHLNDYKVLSAALEVENWSPIFTHQWERRE